VKPCKIPGSLTGFKFMTDSSNPSSSHPSENPYWSIFNSYFHPILITQTNGEIQDLNQAACQILGVSREDIYSRHIEEFLIFEPTKGNAHLPPFSDLINTKSGGEGQIRKANGTLQCIEYRLWKVPSGSGEIILTWLREINSDEIQERRAREQAKILSEIAAILNTSLDRGQVLQLILEELEKVVDYDSASIMLINEDRISIAAQRKFRSEQQLFSSISLKSMRHVNDVLETQQSIIIANTHQDPRWVYKQYADYIHCWLGVPLIFHDRVIGLLNLDKEQVNFYQPKDAEIAEVFANHAAIAIENARLYEEAQRGAQEAETLRQASASVSGTLNLDEAMYRILEQLEGVVPFDSASIQLLHENHLEVVGGRGWPDPNSALGLSFQVPGDNPNTTVIQGKKPLILSDAPAMHKNFIQKDFEYIKSWMGIPLIVHDQVIGMLALDSTKPGFYTQDHARLTAAFADHVAIAIDNARLYTKEKRRLEEAEALRDTLTDLSSELELPRLLQAILERATSLLNAVGGQLGLYESDQNDILIVASHNMGIDYIGNRMKIGEGAMGNVAKNRQMLTIEDYQQWENRSPRYANAGWRAVISAPMMIANRLAGVITIADKNPNRVFDQDDERLLFMLTQQAAIAVENARLYQSVKLAADRRLILYEVSQTIVEAKVNAEAIYKAIHQAAEQLMATESFVICMYSQNDSIEAVYLTDRNGRAKNQVFPVGEGMSGYVIAHGKPLIIHDMLVEEQTARENGLEFIHFGSPDIIRSILTVPMRLGGNVIGAISAQSYRPNAYNEDDLTLLDMLASYAAIALENSRLFKKIQRLAITDSLTDIYNRRHLFVLGQREFNRARRFNRPLSVIFIDIDHFKDINDQYGHRTGDQVLILITRTIQEQIRDIDVMGRYGGEEFLIFIPEVELEATRNIAERIRVSVEQMLSSSRFSNTQVTISLGVVSLTDDIPSLSALVSRADAAMYDAKRNGRNRVSVR
jgi:diguanylate cyclase (GGDEF)-like protein/PAS domain S-box-containing protein